MDGIKVIKIESQSSDIDLSVKNTQITPIELDITTQTNETGITVNIVENPIIDVEITNHTDKVDVKVKNVANSPIEMGIIPSINEIGVNFIQLRGEQGPRGEKGDSGTTNYNELENTPDLTVFATTSEVNSSLGEKADIPFVIAMSIGLGG